MPATKLLINYNNMVKDDEIVTKTFLKNELNEVVTKTFLKSELDKRDSRWDAKLSDFVTKDYLDKRLKNFATKDYLDKRLKGFVTKDYITNEMKKQKYDILREVRVMIYESLETIKIYFEEQGNRHREALLQGFKDEMLIYKDEVRTHREMLEDHRQRIGVLELQK